MIKKGIVIEFVEDNEFEKAMNNALNNGSNSSSSTSQPSSSTTLEKTDFPDDLCKTCGGKKGWYALDVWISCTRCGGTGKEPKH